MKKEITVEDLVKELKKIDKKSIICFDIDSTKKINENGNIFPISSLTEDEVPVVDRLGNPLKCQDGSILKKKVLILSS